VTRLITHLRHIDLGVPDFATERSFYTGLWGLTEVATDTGLSFLAAEGSPEQYVVRLRQAADKRIDLISFGAATPADVDTLALQLGRDGVRMVSEPGAVATPGGGYGFRFFDNTARSGSASRYPSGSPTSWSTRPTRRAPSRSTSATSGSPPPTCSPTRTWAT
jgi:catechol 2,3-dioxygenase-like lactoylglutathione lyase family enzyme